MSEGEEELERLRTALSLVQGDLDRTMTGAPRLQVLVIEPDEAQAEPDEIWAWGDDGLTAYVAGWGGAYWSGSPVSGPTPDDALCSVAVGTQDYLAEVERTVWPLCPRHAHGVHARPPGTSPDWVIEDGGLGAPVWWCRGSGGHDLAVIGQLR